MMTEMRNHSSPGLISQSNSRGGNKPNNIFKWVLGQRMRAHEDSLLKYRQLTVSTSEAFLSKHVTCSEPGTVRSCRTSSPADWWKWLTLGRQLKNQLFTSTRQLPPTQWAAAGRRKGRLLCFVVNLHYPFPQPWSSTISKSIGSSKGTDSQVGHQLHPKHLEISWQLYHKHVTRRNNLHPIFICPYSHSIRINQSFTPSLIIRSLLRRRKLSIHVQSPLSSFFFFYPFIHLNSSPYILRAQEVHLRFVDLSFKEQNLVRLKIQKAHCSICQTLK